MYRGSRGIAMAYFTKSGPSSGRLRSDAGYYALGVLHARETRTPIGEAVADGQDRNGRALWRLTVEAIDLPRLFVVVDRQFRQAGPGDRQSCLSMGIVLWVSWEEAPAIAR
jgi:hypothetical protein